jgi:hypothetical protein
MREITIGLTEPEYEVIARCGSAREVQRLQWVSEGALEAVHYAVRQQRAQESQVQNESTGKTTTPGKSIC